MTLLKEEILLSSNDYSITLTTHRVMQKTAKVNKEIFLKDIISSEVVSKRGYYYIIVTLVFAIPALILLFDTEQRYTYQYVIITLGILAFFGLLGWIFVRERFYKISGKFNDIEFSLKNLKNDHFNKFRNQLEVESENRKREEF